MRFTTAVVLLLFALAVPPNRSVKIFLQKFTSLRSTDDQKRKVHSFTHAEMNETYWKPHVRQHNRVSWAKAYDFKRPLKVVSNHKDFDYKLNRLRETEENIREPIKQNTRVSTKEIIRTPINSYVRIPSKQKNKAHNKHNSGMLDTNHNIVEPFKENIKMPMKEIIGVPITENIRVAITEDSGAPIREINTVPPIKEIIGVPINENIKVPTEKDSEMYIDKDSEVPIETHSGVPIEKNSGVPIEKDRGKQKKKDIKVIDYNREVPTRNNFAMAGIDKLIGLYKSERRRNGNELPTKTSRHNIEDDDVSVETATKAQDVNQNYGRKHVVLGNQQPVVISANSTLQPKPPRLLQTIADVFGLNAHNTWEGIKYIFSIYFNEQNMNSVPKIKHLSSEEAQLDMTHLVKKAGYNLEEHRVKTSDGYILTVYRLLNSLKSKAGPVVFLMHGLVDSADCWVLQGPGRALAYLLVDAGFDVWMGNARGNKYSLRHTTLSSKKSEFWKFTWEEIGLYDLSAMVDYTLAFTEQDKMYYVGHSQGTTCFFVLLSMFPTYNIKFERMFALSPVAYMNHVNSPVLKLFSPAHELLSDWFANLNVYAPITDSFNRIMELLCYLLPRCDNLVNMLVGTNYRNIDETLLPAIFAHMPTGSSTLQVLHYAQLTESGLFCRFDYGKEINLEVYGRIYPAEYELRNIQVPITLFYGGSDWLAVPKDVQTLKSKLIDTVTTEYFISDFSTLDFLYADIAKHFVYERIIDSIKKQYLTL